MSIGERIMRCISRLFAVLALINAIGFMGAPARAQTETALYAFTGKMDGEVPIGGVVRDKKGNLYGVTARGGNGNGVVFKVDKTGRETVLLTFGGGNAGAVPQAGLIMDKHGNLFGTTYFGGTNNFGVVFKVDASGNESVLHMFAGNEGANPIAGLTMDKQGNLYGTVTQGCAHA